MVGRKVDARPSNAYSLNEFPISLHEGIQIAEERIDIINVAKGVFKNMKTLKLGIP
jgi:hypothetical protein